MKLLPFDRFSLVTSKTVEEIQTSLEGVVRKPRWFDFSWSIGPFGSRPAQRYEGSFDNDGFKIWPVIRYRNSFTPVIVGRFEPHHIGLKISIIQRMNFVVTGFVVVWVSLVGVAAVLFLMIDETTSGESVPLEFRFLPVFMIVFAWALSTGGFWWEARHTKDELKLILDAQELMEV